MRSRISTPSRWSISCWSTRASRPAASIVIGSPCSSSAADPDVERPLDVDVDRGQAEAALLGGLELVAPPLDLGVDQPDERRVGPDPVDEHAVQDADLGGGQADAERAVHQLAHARDLVAQRVVDPLHRPRAGAQHRVAELAHVGERRRAAGRELRVELRLGFGLAGSRASGSSSAVGAAGSDTVLEFRRRRHASGRRSLRIDVDADAHAAPGRHRGHARSTAAPTARHRGTALGGLDQELEAVAAAQAKQRRRPEHAARRQREIAGERRGERIGRRPPPRRSRRSGSGSRTAGSAAASRRASSSARNPSASWLGGEAQRPGIGRAGLHEHPGAAGPATGPAGELGDERERPLLGAEVREAQRGIGVEHDAERDVGEVVALGHHLGADQQARRGRGEALERVAPGGPGRCDRRRGAGPGSARCRARPRARARPARCRRRGGRSPPRRRPGSARAPARGGRSGGRRG